MNWMNNPQTICIGRFVLQMPADLQSKWQKYSYNADEIETTTGISLARFNDVVEGRERNLTNKKRMDSTGRTLLQTNVPWLETAVSPHRNSRLFVFREIDARDISGGYVTEGYVWRDSTMFVLKSGADSGKISVAIADEADKIGRIEARDNRIVPAEAGFCFDGGMVAGGTKFYELATAYFERPSTPGGAIFGIEMRPNVPSDDKLLDRVPRLMQMMGNLASHTRTLRRGDRMLAGLDGQEMLTKITADGVTAYYFIWEAKGEPESVVHPNTHIELRVGGELNEKTNRRETSVLSEEDVLVLWDELLNSFRLRPGAV